MTLETPAYHDYHHSTMGRSHCTPLDPHDTLWLFNIAMEAMAHLQMIFPARNFHLFMDFPVRYVKLPDGI